MRKRILPIVITLSVFSIQLSAQVGISTPTPAASLDVSAKNATGTSTTVDGLLAPRVDRQRAQSMLAVPLSTLIYVNSVATGTQTGTAINIDELGYYYFDGTSWTKLKTPAAAAPTVNIYNTNGALTTNRTVSQTDKTLAFTGTAVNAFSVDGSTLSVDATNHRIGFGTAAPTGRIEIVSDNVGPGAENDFYFNGYGSSAAPSLFMGSSRGTAAVPTNLANGDAVGGYYFAPRYNGSQIYTNTGILSNYMGDGTTGLTNLVFKASGTQRAIIDENGNMGIGTAAPNQKLDITSGNVRVRDINTNVGIGGTDRVVVADASGILKTVDNGNYSLFHARLANAQSITAATITTLLFSSPIATSANYSYNTTTGTLTFNQAGNYLVTLQASFTDLAAAGTQLLLGIRPVPDANYLARGSHYNATVTSGNVGELMNYTTMLTIPSAGYQIRFTTAPNANCSVLATETGATGSGNVTNVTIQKI